MTDAGLITTEPPSAELPVEDWRFQQLLRAGCPEQHALLLAADHNIDLHVACDLLADGCDPALACAILL
jgi:hypothetical protein